MNKEKLVFVKCPTCHKKVEWSDKNPHRPFCSKRCQLIDLGEWAKESNRLPSDSIEDVELWSDEMRQQIQLKDDN